MRTKILLGLGAEGTSALPQLVKLHVQCLQVWLRMSIRACPRLTLLHSVAIIVQ